MALVISTRSHAKILKIDSTKALSMEGVVSFFSSKDITEDKRWIGPVFHDEEIFVSEKVLFYISKFVYMASAQTVKLGML